MEKQGIRGSGAGCMPDIANLPKDKFPEKQMAVIAEALLKLAADAEVRAEMPDIDRQVEDFISAIKKSDSLTIETCLTKLYLRLHSAGSIYSSSESGALRMRNGYSCISSGLSPLIKAGNFINPESVVAELGAGNGLQGLLLQYLYPHKKTLQIELSSEMIRIGRIFQEALGIRKESVEWINDDIINVSLKGADFVYVYRPARPSDSGREIYRAIASKLAAGHKPLIVFSIADCLAEFFNDRFSVFYTDGHLTCFSKK